MSKRIYENRVQDIWAEALEKLNVREELGKSYLNAILQAYAHPTRFYHNLQHLQEITDFIETSNIPLDYPGEVLFALLFHDVVYDSKASDNEEQSAEAAVRSLTEMNISKESIERVSQLILATKKHLPIVGLKDSLIFLDADLSILSSTPERYTQYAEAIRKEYSWVPHTDYCTKRAEVMRGFLNREKIYFYSEKYPEREDQARRNISFEIDTLLEAL